MSEPTPLTRETLRAHPLPPVVDGGKETKGRILILAGSRTVPGAALLAARAAMRAGAGKLRIGIDESVAAQVGVAMPEAMVIALAEHRSGGLARSAVGEIATQAEHVDVVVAGPGMQNGTVCAAIAKALLGSPAALVLDAALLRSLQPVERSPNRPIPVLLPHAKELASLLDCSRDEVEREPVRCGMRAAELYRAHVVVKGSVSHVVALDGRAWCYAGGAPGLGVSGSGDVLAGIAGGLLAGGAEPLTALLWAVLLHGEAGERLAAKVGAIGYLARQIADEVPALMLR